MIFYKNSPYNSYIGEAFHQYGYFGSVAVGYWLMKITKLHAAFI